MAPSESEEATELRQFIRTRETRDSNVLSVQESILKSGPQTWSIAAVLNFGDRASGEASHRALILEAYAYRKASGFAFQSPLKKYRLDDNEIEKLKTFLLSVDKAMAPGEHLVLQLSGAPDEWLATALDLLAHGKVDASHLGRFLSGLARFPEAIKALPSVGDSDYRRMIAAGLRAAHRSQALDVLRAYIRDDEKEPKFQTLFLKDWWLLGGRYIALIPKREWTDEETIDLMFQTADGYFELIELKRPSAEVFVRDHGVWVVSGEVNRAVNQAIHYISEIESMRDHFVRRYHVDLFKLKAKVLIGLLSEEDQECSAKREALRKYNSHLHRIEVLTYDQVVKIGEHILDSNIEEASEAALIPSIPEDRLADDLAYETALDYDDGIPF